MEKNFEINQDGQNIRCKLYYQKNTEIKKAILFCHGFAGHKDNNTAWKFADRVLTKYKGTALLAFDLPCHGNDVKKKMQLTDCMTYIDIVIGYIKTELCAKEIYAYATSFGGYLVLKYIAENGNPFAKIALRSPAVNMAESLTHTIMKNDELDTINKGKPALVGFDRKVEITRRFIDELESSDIRKINYIDFAEDILIIHGTKDEVVPFEESRKFADDSIIEFLPVENADHRFQNPVCMEIVTKSVLAFFAL